MQTAQNRNIIINPISPGDITFHSLPSPTGFPVSTTLNWYSVGKLIFGIFLTDSMSGQTSFLGTTGGTGSTVNSISDRLATIMGLPAINTYYTNIHSWGAQVYDYYAGTWHLEVPVPNDRALAIQFLTN